MNRSWAFELPAAVEPRAALLGTGILGGALLIGTGTAFAPFLTMGLVLGALLTVFALTRPLVLVALMLVVGAADLSFFTGGFKTMFTHLGGLDMNGIRLLGLTSALSLVVVADRSVGRELFRPTALFYAALIVFGALTLTYSPAPLHGLRLLLKLAYPLLVFLIIAGTAPSRRTLDRVLDAVLIGAAVLCVIVNPLYVLFGDFERVIGGWVRLRGLGVHQNPFAFYLTFALLASLVRFSTRRQLRYLLLAAVCGGWMVMTITRIAFLGVMFGLFAVAVASAVVARQTRVLVAAVIVAVLLAVPFAPPVLERTLGFVPSAGELVTLLQNPQKLYAGMNMEGRQVVWAVLFEPIRREPLLGTGLGGATHILSVHFPWFTSPAPHNDYLRLLTDTGVLGMTLLTLAMVMWTAGAARAARLPDRTCREYGLAAIGLVAAYAIIGTTDNPFDYYGQLTQYVGFLCGGAVAAAACYGRSSRAPDPVLGSGPRSTAVTVPAGDPGHSR